MEKKIDWGRLFHGLLHWAWVPAVLYWIILSSGIFSELAFLLASIWKSVNSSDHKFVLLFMTELQSQNGTYWANSAYIVLSVCILPLAAVTTYRHARTWIYEKKFAPGLWVVLYGLPTLTFLVIDLAIMGNSDTTYTLPDYLVSARTIMAYTYGLTAILYHFVGKEQEVDRLRKKDVFIAELIERNRLMVADVDALKAEMGAQKQALVDQKQAQKRLLEELQKSDDEALEAYGQECIAWLKSGIKTASLEEIIRYTCHAKRKLNGANLQRSSRNPELILISSLVPWLKSVPVPEKKSEENATNTSSQNGSNGHLKETVNLDEYPEILV